MEYTLLKLLHVVAVVIFLGNIFTGLFWMHIAVKSRDVRIISHTIKGVIKSDRLFTLPCVILITTFGFWAAIQGRIPILGTGWILWSLILFSISGIAFAVKVAPLQKKLDQLTFDKENSSDLDWEAFNNVYVKWEIWGAIALITPIAALVMMTLKLPL
ncbi:MAG: DUF2269 family protein [Cyclobacteriaceae bacterium]